MPGDGPHPMEGSLVFVHYSLYQDGRTDVIDSTKMHGKSWMFRVGAAVVTVGLDQVVRNMRQGGEVEAYMEPGCGLFGAETFNDVNKRLNVEKGVYMRVELLDVNNNKAAKMMVGMTNSEVKMAPFSMVYDAAMLEKDEGNKYTKKKRLLVEGVGRYGLALKWLGVRDQEEFEEDELKKRDLMATLMINVALVTCKCGYFRLAKTKAQEALEYAKTSDRVIKARLYAARGCRGLKEYEEALEHVREGKKIGHHELLDEEEIGIRMDIKVAREEEKERFKKMAGALFIRKGDEEMENKRKETPEEALPVDFKEQVNDDLEGFIYDETQTVYNIPKTYTESQKRFIVFAGENCGLEVGREGTTPVSLTKPSNFRPIGEMQT